MKEGKTTFISFYAKVEYNYRVLCKNIEVYNNCISLKIFLFRPTVVLPKNYSKLLRVSVGIGQVESRHELSDESCSELVSIVSLALQ